MNTEFEAALQRSDNWMVVCANVLDGVTFDPSVRNRIAVGLHHLCIEHHQGAHVLIGTGVRGSAFALYRPQFEAYARAEWYHYCATDLEIGRYVRGEEPPRIGKLATDLKQVKERSGDVIWQVKHRTWGAMCAFTHGGAVQVKARMCGNEIRQSYTDDHAGKLLDAMAVLSYLAALGIAAVADDEGLAKQLYDQHQSIYSGVYRRS
ncbi:DUF6988 family protein [Burkholderia multivorans]|uniref:DUF6988 family protein n=1 Tax=Burkholderia multivorans TaxID=87883 RepID=UPI00201A1DC5|nr:hypothetical protein [Burkholderia multivorans]MCA8143575.1 hypothetical protein [Burkholderia multivorans]MCO1368583.1 hypothetical protein [Burkholderia multivorans]MCO1380474.1 hypothetical protein [Burkholderia multivorans]MDN8032130.1 hypothetical protein [Burkholderia multivorans]UQP21419.1 hypothetical protein L0Y98_18310 [Burkholderia multivorans]